MQRTTKTNLIQQLTLIISCKQPSTGYPKGNIYKIQRLKANKEVSWVATRKTKKTTSKSKHENRSKTISLEEISHTLHRLKGEVQKSFRGNEQLVEQVILSLIAGSHLIIKTNRGMGQSTLATSLARTIEDTTISRIYASRHTSEDNLRGDIQNVEGNMKINHQKNPLFCNVVLVERLFDAPYLIPCFEEGMKEREITIRGVQYPVPKPFFVIATIDEDHPLVQDMPWDITENFLFMTSLTYPDRNKEKEIIKKQSKITGRKPSSSVKEIVSQDAFNQIQRQLGKVYLSDKMTAFIIDLTEATRGNNPSIEGNEYIKRGASVKASIDLARASKAKALYEGRDHVLPEDVISIFKNALCHRISINHKGKANGITTERVIDEIMEKIDAI